MTFRYVVGSVPMGVVVCVCAHSNNMEWNENMSLSALITAGWVCSLSRLRCLFFSLQQMRVRTITGTNYYMRSGVRITGKVHERFMLIDGHKVATGSYR